MQSLSVESSLSVGYLEQDASSVYSLIEKQQGEKKTYLKKFQWPLCTIDEFSKGAASLDKRHGITFADNIDVLYENFLCLIPQNAILLLLY